MKHPMCAECGHQKAKHVESVMEGHVICVAKDCTCTLYKLPKDGGGRSDSAMTPYQVGEMVREAAAAGRAAAEEGLRKCLECGHTALQHPQIDDHKKMQARWPCTACGCQNFLYFASTYPRSQNELRRAHGLTVLKEDDPVNHPSHYTAYPGIEIIQLTRRMSFNRGNAVKYVARAGLKNKDTEVQDLEKAIWYLQDEVKLLKGEYEDNG